MHIGILLAAGGGWAKYAALDVADIAVSVVIQFLAALTVWMLAEQFDMSALYAAALDRRVAQVRSLTPIHPLYCDTFPVSDRGLGAEPR